MKRHVLISIVNCEKPELHGYGYYAAKAAQERFAREHSPDIILARSTQWFEFGQMMTKRLSFGPLAGIPAMLIKPLALDTFAEKIAGLALEGAAGSTHNYCGPEEMRLLELAKKTRGGALPLMIPLPLPGEYGKAFRSGELVPAEGAAEVALSQSLTTDIASPPLSIWAYPSEHSEKRANPCLSRCKSIIFGHIRRRV